MCDPSTSELWVTKLKLLLPQGVLAHRRYLGTNRGMFLNLEVVKSHHATSPLVFSPS